MTRAEVDAALARMRSEEAWTSSIVDVNSLVYALAEQRDAAERLARAERAYRVAIVTYQTMLDQGADHAVLFTMRGVVQAAGWALEAAEGMP